MRNLFLSLALIIWAAPAVTAQTDSEYDIPTSTVALTARVLEIFEMSCAECHDETSGKRVKGEFGHILDLERQLEDEFYLVAGDPDYSENFALMTTDDEDLVMPPPDSTVHQPTAEEIEIVRAWIVAMGEEPLPDAAAIEAFKVAEAEKLAAEGRPTVISEEAKKSVPPVLLFARTHPMVVHFPIGLLLMAVFVEFLGLLLRKQDAWGAAVRWGLGISAFTGIIAAIAGWLLVDPAGYSDERVFGHRWLGVSTAALSVICFVLVTVADKTQNARLMWAFRALLLVTAVVVSIAGHTGGELVYGEGYPFN